MALPLDTVVQQLRESGVVAPEQLAKFLPPNAAPKDGDALCLELVKQNLLTKFQAQQVAAGKTRTLLLDVYTIVDKIGAGGMGQVFKARHRRMERTVALKVMSPAAMKDEAAVKRFQREVRAAARLEHPNIVTAYDSGEAGNVKYLVMQFVDGGDLSDLVKKNGPLPIEKAVNFVLQAARGLAFAHAEGVIHRDIKPANLLLDKKGVVKILDMGLARIESSDDGLTATEQVMGTVDYMSPEQAANTKGVDGRADIYSLGCTLWFLLTGKKAYEADSMIARLMAHKDAPLPSLVKTRDDAPWPLEQAFHRMIAKRAEDRFQSMDEVIAALEPFAAGGISPTGMGSSLGQGSQNAELSAFLKGVGPATKPQAKPSPSKTNVEVEATAQFVSPDVATDPKSEIVASGKLAAGLAPRAAAKPQAKGAGAKTPTNKNLILAGAGGAALLVLLGVWFIFRDKDGNETARVQLPPGGSVTVQPSGTTQFVLPPTPPRPTASPSSSVSFFNTNPSTDAPPPGDYELKLDHADAPLNLDLTQPFTLEAYITPSGDSERTQMAFDCPKVVNLYGGRKWGFAVGDQGKNWNMALSSISPVAGKRTHVAGVFTPQRIQLFIDGVLEKTTELNGSNLPPSAPLGIGYQFSDRIDEIRVSKTARYTANFKPSARHAPDADTLLLYHCDEGHGNLLTDASGNRRDALVHGALWTKTDGSPISITSSPASNPSPAAAPVAGGWTIVATETRDGPARLPTTGAAPTISSDGLTFVGSTSGTERDVTMATRNRLGDPWPTPVNLGPVVNVQGGLQDAEDGYATISQDRKSLVFFSKREKSDALWSTVRADAAQSFAAPVRLSDEINSPNRRSWYPGLSADGQWLTFLQAKGSREYTGRIARRKGAGPEFAAPQPLGPAIDALGDPRFSTVTDDGLTLVIVVAQTPAPEAPKALWTATRSSTDAPFENPVELGPEFRESNVLSASISGDGRTLWVIRNGDLIQAVKSVPPAPTTRPSLTVAELLDSPDYAWTEPENLGPTINGPGHERIRCLTGDELRLYFHRKGGSDGKQDEIWEVVRTSRDAAFAQPRVVAKGSGTYISGDGRMQATAGPDISVRRRASLDGSFDEAIPLDPAVNSAADERRPIFSADGLAIVYSSDRDNASRPELWMTRRASQADPFGPPTKFGRAVNDGKSVFSGLMFPDGKTLLFRNTEGLQLTFVSSAGIQSALPLRNHPFPDNRNGELNVWISPDGRTAYFSADRPGGLGDQDIYVTRRVPKGGGATTNASLPSPSPVNVVYLDDLQEVEWQGRDSLGKHGHDHAGRPFNWPIVPPKHSLVMKPRANSNALVGYDLAGRYETFDAAIVASINQADTFGPVTFRVVGDGRELWKSAPRPPRSGEVPMSVSVAGVQRLQLEVVASGETSLAYSLWLDPRLTPVAAPPTTPAVVYLDDLQEARWAGRGDLGKHGRKAKIDGGGLIDWFLYYPKHSLFGTPGDSSGSAVIEYDLAGRYAQFDATVGLLSEPGSPHTFRVWGDDKKLWESPPLSDPNTRNTLVSVDVAGVKRLKLELVTGGKPGAGFPVWIDPRLTPAASVAPPQVTPAAAPPPAVFPFDAAVALKHQEAWARHLGVPVEFTNDVGMKFRLIPPGEFQMGLGPEFTDEELTPLTGPPGKHLINARPAHLVRITKPFYLEVAEITSGHYRNVVGQLRPEMQQDPNKPLTEFVSFPDAVAFCNKLSEREGKRPAYQIAGDQITPIDEADGYRLPTEAQWEFACRAGTNTLWYFGNDRGADNNEFKKHCAAPNPFGLTGLYGGSNEWCWDCIPRGGSPYSGSLLDRRDDPQEEVGPHRIKRGGSGHDGGGTDRRIINSFARSTAEGGPYDPAAAKYTGFGRVVLPIAAATIATPGPSSGAIDLLPRVRIDQPLDGPAWSRDLQGIITGSSTYARTLIDVDAPDEYDLLCDVVPLEGNHSLVLGLSRGGKRFWIPISGWKRGETKIEPPPTTGTGLSVSRELELVADRPAQFICSVRRSGVTLTGNGKTLIDWKGDTTTLTEWDRWQVPEPQKPAIGSWVGVMRITRLELRPITGTASPSPAPPTPASGDSSTTKTGETTRSAAPRWPLAPSKPEDVQALLGMQAELTLRSASAFGDGSVDAPLNAGDPMPKGSATIVGVKLNGKPVPTNDDALRLIAGLIDLESLVIAGQGDSKHNVTSAGLLQLRSLTQLRQLGLSGANEQAAGATAMLATMPHLEVIRLPYGVADEWAAAVAVRPSITQVHAYRADLTDAGLAHLEKMPQLTEVNLEDNPRLTQAAIDRFTAAVPNCRITYKAAGVKTLIEPRTLPKSTSSPPNDFPEAKTTTAAPRWPLAPSKPEDIQWLLARNCVVTLRGPSAFGGDPLETSLKAGDAIPSGSQTVVGIDWETRNENFATDDDLARIATFVDLEQLNFKDTAMSRQITSAGMLKLAALVNLRRLTINQCKDKALGAEGILQAMPHLEFLHLPFGTNVSSVWAAAAAARPSITEIRAFRCEYTDANLVHFEKMPQLTLLDLSDNATLTEAAVEKLAAAKPHCRIIASFNSERRIFEPRTPSAPAPK